MTEDRRFKLITLKQVQEQIGFKKSAIYKMISEGKFPSPVKISYRASRWKQIEIDQWVTQQTMKRDRQSK